MSERLEQAELEYAQRLAEKLEAEDREGDAWIVHQLLAEVIERRAAPSSSPEASGEERIGHSACKLYCDWYEGRQPELNAETVAYELVSTLRLVLASLTQARSTIAGLQDAGNRMLARKDEEIAGLRKHAEAMAGALDRMQCQFDDQELVRDARKVLDAYLLAFPPPTKPEAPR